MTTTLSMQSYWDREAAAYLARPSLYAKSLEISEQELPLWVQGIQALLHLAASAPPQALVTADNLIEQLPHLSDNPRVVGAVLRSSNVLASPDSLFTLKLVNPRTQELVSVASLRDAFSTDYDQAVAEFGHFQVVLERTSVAVT